MNCLSYLTINMERKLGDKMMDRLTINNTLIKCQDCLENSNCYNHSCNHINETIKKLAYYEDLEESGKLPLLHIGCDVYFRVKGMNQFGAYVDFIQTQKIGRIDIDINGILYCTASVKFIISDLGKSVFLTREEAEEKLKEMK